MGHVVTFETSLALTPASSIDVEVGVAICLPPICCSSKQLVHREKILLIVRTL
jgi:hypothetical protein